MAEITRSIRVRAQFATLVALFQLGCSLVDPNLPPLLDSSPSDGEKGFPISGWVVLDWKTDRIWKRVRRKWNSLWNSPPWSKES